MKGVMILKYNILAGKVNVSTKSWGRPMDQVDFQCLPMDQ